METSAPARTRSDEPSERSTGADIRRWLRFALTLVSAAALTGTLMDRQVDSSWPGPGATANVQVRHHVVRPGESFWSIATALNREGDPRPMVAALVTAHGGSELQVGDRVVLPDGP